MLAFSLGRASSYVPRTVKAKREGLSFNFSAENTVEATSAGRPFAQRHLLGSLRSHTTGGDPLLARPFNPFDSLFPS